MCYTRSVAGSIAAPILAWSEAVTSGMRLTSILGVGGGLVLSFLCNACFGGEMRAVSYSAIVTGLVSLGSLAASNHGTAGSYFAAASDHGTAASYSDRACGMPVQLSCRGCAVTCPASKQAICRAGINICEAMHGL